MKNLALHYQAKIIEIIKCMTFTDHYCLHILVTFRNLVQIELQTLITFAPYIIFNFLKSDVALIFLFFRDLFLVFLLF